MAFNVTLRTLLIFLSLACSCASRGETRKEFLYENGRFGVALHYPAVLKKDERSSANGDGQTFHNGPIALTVYGSNDIFTPSETMKIMTHEKFKYTYKQQLPDGLVLSGTKGDKIIYQRCKRKLEVIGCFEIIYPIESKAFWDKAVIRMSQSLRVEPPLRLR